jgi:hypothetical protein
MHHLIAPSSMLEIAPTSIYSSSQKGMRTHHPNLSRSRRDTPSSGPSSPVRRVVSHRLQSAESGRWYASRSAESQLRMASRPLCRGLRERCRNGGGMDAGVVAYSREPRRVELREQSRRPLAAINKVVGEIVDEDPDRWSQSSAGREHKMKGDFLRAPTGEYPNQASFADRSHGDFSR